MITIGIRAAPTEVTFAIFDAALKSIKNVDEIRIPPAFHWPETLKYVRSNLLDIIREYKVKKAGIRLSEPTAKTVNIERIHIEGVIQEAFASSDLQNYFTGSIATIAARLSVDRAAIKLMVGGENHFRIDGWGNFTDKQREALLTSLGAENA